MFERKKIALICSSSNTSKGRLTENGLATRLAAMPELGIIADARPFFLSGDASVEIRPEQWPGIAKEIHSRLQQYDGVAVIHGLDTLLYTASAMAFMLRNLGKPVIFTGSHLPSMGQIRNLSDPHFLGLKANLINAVQAATLDLAEVGVMFGGQLIRAVSAKRMDPYSVDVFDPVAHKDMLGTVGLGLNLGEHARHRSSVRAKLQPEIDRKVALVNAVPGAGQESLERALDENDGVILSSFGSSEFLNANRKLLAKHKNKPVVAYGGRKNYAGMRNVLGMRNLTLEALLPKFMWSLGQGRELVSVKKRLLTNYAGELH